MIHLNVLTSIDPNAPGLYEFEYDVLSIGRSIKNDLILNEENVAKCALYLSIENNTLFIQTLSNSIFCLVNGKKISGKKRLDIGDKVEIGKSKIEIIQFKKTNDDLNFGMLYENFLKKFPDHKYILEALDVEIEELEKSKGN